MDRDPRAKELYNLKLALATFALQLDAFEARLKSAAQNNGPFHSAPPDIRLANKLVSASVALGGAALR